MLENLPENLLRRYEGTKVSRLFWLVGIVALCVYRLTMAPGLTWAHAGSDGGDLATAAAVWGVPHPPGYPTYTLLGHLFARLPFGDVAFNLNLLSALSGALACALLAASVRRCLAPQTFGGSFASAIAGLTLAFGPMLWGQATITEAYALNALFVAAMCFIALPWSVEPRRLSPGAKATLGLLWGSGLGNSTTLLALAPIALPALWRDEHGRGRGFATLALGLCVYVLIPLRAATNPPISWGNARTLENFLWLASGSMYRGYALAAPLDVVLQRLIGLPRVWLEQMGWVGVAWIGYEMVARAELKRVLSPAIAVALYAAFAITYNTTDSDLYLIPIWVLSAGYLGTGLAHGLDAASSRARRAPLCVLAAATVAAMLIGNWRTHDLSADRRASDFAEAMLRTAPADSILLAYSDAHTFSLWYYRLAVGRRPDVAIIDARMVDYPWYTPMLNAQGAAPVLPEDRTSAGLADRLALANPGRTVCQVALPLLDKDFPTLHCR